MVESTDTSEKTIQIVSAYRRTINELQFCPSNRQYTARSVGMYPAKLNGKTDKSPVTTNSSKRPLYSYLGKIYCNAL